VGRFIGHRSLYLVSSGASWSVLELLGASWSIEERSRASCGEVKMKDLTTYCGAPPANGPQECQVVAPLQLYFSWKAAVGNMQVGRSPSATASTASLRSVLDPHQML
jgi:hypothetical protein